MQYDAPRPFLVSLLNFTTDSFIRDNRHTPLAARRRSKRHPPQQYRHYQRNNCPLTKYCHMLMRLPALYVTLRKVHEIFYD